VAQFWPKSPRIPAFYTQAKINKTIPAGRPIVFGSGGPKKRISSFVDSLLPGQSRKNKSFT